MDTVAALLTDARERERTAFDATGRTTAHSARDFATSVWKAANLLRHYGVRTGATVAVVVGPKEPAADAEPGRLAGTADPLLAILGGMRLGAVVDVDPAPTVDATALVAPDAWLDRYEPAPGCSRLAYGGPPEDPAVAHFERERWSENPVEPPEAVEPGTVAIDDGSEHTQGTLLDRAQTVAESQDMSGTRVAVRGRLDTGVFVAGVLAPLLAGGTIVGGPDPAGDLVVDAGGDVGPQT